MADPGNATGASDGIPKFGFPFPMGENQASCVLDATADFDKTYEQTVNSWINPTFDTGMIF